MPSEKTKLLTPDECVLILIDHQPQMLFSIESANRTTLINNVVGLAKGAKVFNVPTILTTVGAKSFAGPLFPDLQAVFPEFEPLDRTFMNAWEDKKLHAAVEKIGRKKLIIAGLWTEICVAFPVLDAMREGYEVYFIADASAGVSVEAHHMAIQRMIQAGAVPLTWEVLLAEWQRDWARVDTALPLDEVFIQHGGTFGQGLLYHRAMYAHRDLNAIRASTSAQTETQPRH